MIKEAVTYRIQLDFDGTTVDTPTVHKTLKDAIAHAKVVFKISRHRIIEVHKEWKVVKDYDAT